MTSLETIIITFDVLLWITLITVKAYQPARVALSAYELRRRSSDGDQVAAHEVWRDALLPRLLGLKWLVETGLIFVAITILFSTLKPLAAILVSLCSLLLTDILSRQRVIASWSNRQFGAYEPAVLRYIDNWNWLNWFSRQQDMRNVRIGSRDELVQLIEQLPRDILSKDDSAMLAAQLAFSSKTVADVMTPRSMVEVVQEEEAIGPLLLDRLHHTGHSRFPVISGDLDHVVGTLYLHDLVGIKTSHTTARQAMNDVVYYIAGGQTLEHALHAFLRTHHHLFIVVNEYRETVGVLSLEDVIETLIGRSIVDEFDEFEDLRAVAAKNPKMNNDPKGKKDI